MDKAKQEATARWRRALSRSLLVLGGAVAATAASWAVSTATASAQDALGLADGVQSVVGTVSDTQLSDIQVPGTAGAHGPADAGALVADLADGVGGVIDAPVDPGLGGGATHVVDEVGLAFADRLTPQWTQPGAPQAAPAAASLPRPATPAPAAAEPEPGQPVAAPAPGGAHRDATAIAVETAGSAVERIPGSPRRGSPGASPEAPVQPSGPGPLAPMSLPAPVHPGQTGAGAGDAPHLGLLAAVPAAAEPTTADALRSAQVRLPSAVGAQPGVTPD